MKTLILTDLQNDFMPGGALPVARGDELVPIVNRLVHGFDLVVATQDWHPPNHGSFAANHPGKLPGDTIDLNGLEQVLWPIHCIQGAFGAALHKDLDTSTVARVFQKGADPKVDSYSGFFDNARRKSTGLEEYLKEKGAAEVYVCGLATDYCVKFTALDARELGFRTFLIRDACRGVDLNPGDVRKAIGEIAGAGVEIVESPGLMNDSG